MTTDTASHSNDEQVLSLAFQKWRDGFTRRGNDAPPETLCPDQPHLLSLLRSLIGMEKLNLGGAAPRILRAQSSYTIVGPYEGDVTGGQGDLYVAIDHEYPRTVLVKRIKPEKANDPDARSRFEREFLLNGQLQHPNIVPVYDFGIDEGGDPFYVMRLVPGETLHVRVGKLYGGATRDIHHSSEFLELLRHFITVCRAVSYAHSRRALHLDISTMNVRLGTFGEVYLLDWGCGRQDKSDQDETFAETSDAHEQPVQTISSRKPNLRAELSSSMNPAFMAPEQAMMQPLTRHTDIYQLGAVLYVLLTGKFPFAFVRPGSAEFRDLQRRVAAGDFARPSKLVPAAPEFLETVCLKAMATREADRFPSVVELADATERWLDGFTRDQLLAPVRNELQSTSQSLETHKVDLKQKTEELVTSHRDWSTRVRSVKRVATGLLAITAVITGVMVYSLQSVSRLETKKTDLELIAARLTVEADAAQEASRRAREQLETSNNRAEAVESELLQTAIQEAVNLTASGNTLAAQSVVNRVGDRIQLDARFPAGLLKSTLSQSRVKQKFLRASKAAVSDVQMALASYFSPDGKTITTYHPDEQLVVWDTATGQPLREIPVGPGVGRLGLAFDLVDGKVSITGVVPDGAAEKTVPAINPGDFVLASGSSGETLLPTDGMDLNVFMESLKGEAGKAHFLKIQTGNREPRVVEIRRKRFPRSTEPLLLHRFSEDGEWLATSVVESPGQCAVWLVRTSDGSVVHQWKFSGESNTSVMALDFSADSTRILVVGETKTIESELQSELDIRELPSLAPLAKFTHARFALPGIVFSGDGKSVMGNGLGKRTFIGKRTFPELHEASVENLPKAVSAGGLPVFSRMSPNGRFWASVGFDRVEINDGKNGRYLLRPEFPIPISATAFSPDGSLFAVASKDTEIAIYTTWNWRLVLRSRILPTPGAMQSSLRSIAFSPDNLQVLCGTVEAAYLIDLSNPDDRLGTTVADQETGVLSGFRWGKNGESGWGILGNSGIGSGLSSISQFSARGKPINSLCDRTPSFAVPAVLSESGKSIFVTRTDSDLNENATVERWDLEPVLNRIWTTPVNRHVAKAVAGGSINGVFVEMSDSSHSQAVNIAPPAYGTRVELDLQTGQSLGSRSIGYGGAFRASQVGLLAADPFPSQQQLGEQPRFWLEDWKTGTRSKTLNTQVMNAVVSSDGKFLIAMLASKDQAPQMKGQISVFSLPELTPVATMDREITIPYDYGLDISPDGNLIAVGTMDGEIIVWSHVEDKVVYESRLNPELFGNDPQIVPLVSGLAFDSSGKKLIFAGHNWGAYGDPDQFDRWRGKFSGVLGVIELSPEKSDPKIFRKDLGMVFLGPTDALREKISTTDGVSGRTDIWDINSQQLVASIPDPRDTFFDDRWASLATIHRVTESPDAERVALIGQVRDAPQSQRLLIMDVDTKRVVASRDFESFGTIADLCWLEAEICILSHMEVAPVEPATESRVQCMVHRIPESMNGDFISVKLPDLLPSVIPASKGHFDLQPHFSPNGSLAVVPVKDGAQQGVVVVATRTGVEQGRFPQSSRWISVVNWKSEDEVTVVTGDLELNDLKTDAICTRSVHCWRVSDNNVRSVKWLEMKEAPPFTLFSQDTAWHAAISKDGDTIALARSLQPYIELWSFESQSMTCKIPLEQQVQMQQLEFSPSGETLLVGCSDRTQFYVAVPPTAPSSELEPAIDASSRPAPK